MYLTDPTLYGATIPQREYPFVPPFMTNYFTPWQWQQNLLPYQEFPQIFPPNIQHGQLPYVPQGYGFQQPFMKFPVVPPTYNTQFFPPIQQGTLPFVPQGYGLEKPFMNLPVVPPAYNPYMTYGMHNLPFWAWQKGLTY